MAKHKKKDKEVEKNAEKNIMKERENVSRIVRRIFIINGILTAWVSDSTKCNKR